MTEPLIIERVTLKNFLSHRDTTVEFTRGVNVLIGPNGAGKTSILEAIHYALTGKGWRTEGRSKKSLVNERAREAEVVLEFTYDGHRYRIHRFIGGKPSIIYMDDKPVAQGEAQVDRVVRELLGAPLDQLDKIVIIRQGGITRLFTQLKPSERKEAVDQLLGLYQYQEVGESLKDQIEFRPGTKTATVTLRPVKTLESEIRRIAGQITDLYKRKMTDYLSLDKELAEAKEKLSILEEKAEKLQPLAEKYEEINHEYAEISKKHGELLGSKKSLEEELEKLKKQIEGLDNTIKEITEEMQKYEKELEVLGLEETINQLGKLIDEKKLVEGKIETLSQLLKDKEKLLRSITELRREVIYSYSEIESKLAKIGEDLEKLRGEKTRLEKEEGGVEDRLKHLDREKDEINGMISQAASLYKELFGEHIEEPEKLLKNIEEKYGELRTRYEDIENKLLEIEKSVSAHESRIKEVRDKIKLLESAKEPICPLCGQPLTEEHRNSIVEKLRKEIRTYEEELNRLVEEKNKLIEEKKGIEEKLEKITETLISDLKQSLEKLRSIDKEIIDLENRKKEITEEISRIGDEIADLEKERETLKEMKSKAETLQELEQAFNEEEYRNIQLQISELREKLDSIKEEIDKLVRKITEKTQIEAGSPEELHSKIIELLEEARKAREKLDKMKGELEVHKQQLQKYISDYREKEEQLGRITRELEEIEKRRSELEKLREEAGKAQKELSDIKEEIAGLKTLIQSHDERKKKLEEEIEEIKKDVEEINRAYRKAAVLRWIIEKLFSREGIPKHLRPRILRILETYMEQYMNEFNLGFQDIEFDENYNIYFRPVEDPSVKRPLARLSGGEQVSMSMVALLALFHLVSQSRIGFMALDEPTEYLDEERQKALVELLKKFQGGRILPQLIIVTHDESVKEAADRIYLVEKINGVSRVTLVEPGGEM